MSDEVEYRIVTGHEHYRVGNDGTVWSNLQWKRKDVIVTGPWKRLKPSIQYRGHRSVNLGRENPFYVHELVAMMFIGPRPDGLVIRHLDGDPSNNNVENLKYGSHSENYADRILHGTDNLTHRPNAKLDVDKVLEIVRMWRDEGTSQDQLATLFDVHPTNITAIVTGRSWSSITGIEYKPKANMNTRGRPRIQLTDDDVREIRRLYKEGVKISEIFRKFDVSRTAISLIANRKNRTNVPD